MEPLIRAATKSTPAIHFDADTGILCIQGESYPENATAYYQPLIQWVEQYLAQLTGTAVLQLQLQYLNTSSTRCMLTLLDKFDAAFQQGKAVSISWYYHHDDDRAVEAGEEFQEGLIVPFTIQQAGSEEAR